MKDRMLEAVARARRLTQDAGDAWRRVAQIGRADPAADMLATDLLASASISRRVIDALMYGNEPRGGPLHVQRLREAFDAYIVEVGDRFDANTFVDFVITAMHEPAGASALADWYRERARVIEADVCRKRTIGDLT